MDWLSARAVVCLSRNVSPLFVCPDKCLLLFAFNICSVVLRNWLWEEMWCLIMYDIFELFSLIGRQRLEKVLYTWNIAVMNQMVLWLMFDRWICINHSTWPSLASLMKANSIEIVLSEEWCISCRFIILYTLHVHVLLDMSILYLDVEKPEHTLAHHHKRISILQKWSKYTCMPRNYTRRDNINNMLDISLPLLCHCHYETVCK